MATHFQVPKKFFTPLRTVSLSKNPCPVKSFSTVNKQILTQILLRSETLTLCTVVEFQPVYHTMYTSPTRGI
jgi:hypothetical protein